MNQSSLFQVFISNKLYLTSNKDEKNLSYCELEKKQDGWLLRGLYYGSSTCIRSDGLGWIGEIKYPTSFETLREMKDFPKVINKKKIKITILVGIDKEEIEFEYPKNYYTPYIELEETEVKRYCLLKGIYFRELSRFSFISNEDEGYLYTPIEISGFKFNEI
jgi:hypothetical protein